MGILTLEPISECLGLYGTQVCILIQEEPLYPTFLQSVTLFATSFKINGVNRSALETEEGTWPSGKG